MTKTDTSANPAGILTDTEADALTDPETDVEELTDLRARVRTRLTETLRDLTVLYPTLPDEDLDTVFNPADETDQSTIRAATQDGLALLILGMFHGDDMVEMRIRDALVNAGVSYGEEIDVTLKLRRGPLPTLEQFAAQVDSDGPTEQTLPLFEYFLGQPDADFHTLEDIASELQMDITAADRDEIQTALASVERYPQTVITSVTVTEQPQDENRGDDI
jgi:hypothetical protein